MKGLHYTLIFILTQKKFKILNETEILNLDFNCNIYM